MHSSTFATVSVMSLVTSSLFFFLFYDPSTTEIYTLSLHDALPIFLGHSERLFNDVVLRAGRNAQISIELQPCGHGLLQDRKSTRLNSSHVAISYAVFCLKKKKKTK